MAARSRTGDHTLTHKNRFALSLALALALAHTPTHTQNPKPQRPVVPLPQLVFQQVRDAARLTMLTINPHPRVGRTKIRTGPSQTGRVRFSARKNDLLDGIQESPSLCSGNSDKAMKIHERYEILRSSIRFGARTSPHQTPSVPPKSPFPRKQPSVWR